MSLIDVVAAGVISGKASEKISQKKEGLAANINEIQETIESIRYGCKGRYDRNPQPCVLTNGIYYKNLMDLNQRSLEDWAAYDRCWHQDEGEPVVINNSFPNVVGVLWILTAKTGVIDPFLRFFPFVRRLMSDSSYMKAIESWQYTPACRSLVSYVLQKPIIRLLKIKLVGDAVWAKYYLESGFKKGDIPGLERIA